MYVVTARPVFPPLLLLAFGCCDCSANRPEPPVPSVTGLRIVPSKVYAVSGVVFVMRARMVDANGGFWTSHPQLTWAASGGLQILDRGGDSVTVEAEPASSGTTATRLTAQLGDRTAEAIVTVLDPNAPGTMDSALGDSRTGMAPDVMLMDNLSAPEPFDDSVIAFVGIGLLGDVSAGSGEIARFANSQSFELAARTWLTTNDVIDLRSPTDGEGSIVTTVRAPTSATFRVWIATGDADAMTNATQDVQFAQRVFAREYTGVALHALLKPASGAGPFILERGPPPDLKCLNLAETLTSLGVPIATRAFSKESLNVVYVDDIFWPPTDPSLVGTSALMSGYACPRDSELGGVIIISSLRRSYGTLTHELGHELGLREPNGGHTSLEPGFGYSNMMWPWETDASVAPRSSFSLGQGFRINADDLSWLQYLTALTPINCDPTGADRRCPLLERDLP